MPIHIENRNAEAITSKVVACVLFNQDKKMPTKSVPTPTQNMYYMLFLFGLFTRNTLTYSSFCPDGSNNGVYLIKFIWYFYPKCEEEEEGEKKIYRKEKKKSIKKKDFF